MDPLNFICGFRVAVDLYLKCFRASHACVWCRTLSMTQAPEHSQWLASCLLLLLIR